MTDQTKPRCPRCPTHNRSMEHAKGDDRYWICGELDCGIFVSEDRINSVLQFFPAQPDEADREDDEPEHDTYPCKLNPCPFCGGGAELRRLPDTANFIECLSCGATTNLQYSIKDDGRPWLIERWNRRSPFPQAQLTPEDQEDIRQAGKRVADPMWRLRISALLSHIQALEAEISRELRLREEELAVQSEQSKDIDRLRQDATTSINRAEAAEQQLQHLRECVHSLGIDLTASREKEAAAEKQLVSARVQGMLEAAEIAQHPYSDKVGANAYDGPTKLGSKIAEAISLAAEGKKVEK